MGSDDLSAFEERAEKLGKERSERSGTERKKGGWSGVLIYVPNSSLTCRLFFFFFWLCWSVLFYLCFFPPFFQFERAVFFFPCSNPFRSATRRRALPSMRISRSMT